LAAGGVPRRQVGTTGARAAWPTARSAIRQRPVTWVGRVGRGGPILQARTDHHIVKPFPRNHFSTTPRLHTGFRPRCGRTFYGKAKAVVRRPTSRRAHTASVFGGLPPCPRRVQGPRCGPPIGYGGGLPLRCWPHRAAGDLPTGALPPIVSALARSRRCSLLCLRASMRDPRGGRRPAAGSAVPPAGAPPCLNMPVGFMPAVTEVRGPIGPRHRWSLWIHGRWPSLIPRFPGGAAPR
jgi:hypothetical protein